jgi:Fe-S-cluster containining protein
MLVLSMFPGIGLLDMAFELEGFFVVRGPDVLWGVDARRFVSRFRDRGPGLGGVVSLPAVGDAGVGDGSAWRFKLLWTTRREIMKRTALPLITNCDSCGACCTGQAALPVHLVGTHFRSEAVSPLPESLQAELRAAIETFQRDGWPADGTPCMWYDAEKKQCKHYEHRPVLCRDEVKVGDEACRRWRRSMGIDP